ncbi:MAG: hypothetical protein IKR28_11380 [Selenomonadaceae bacterium]|nr:hypothetical protein [Selenomonadaceae bacterium]
MSEIPDGNLYQRIVECYLKEKKVAVVAKELHVPASKVRRVLITEGLWSSPTSRRIAALLSEGLKKEEIAKKLHCSVHAVEFYLPYQRGAYGLSTPSDTAKRIEGYRKRKAKASSSQVFFNDNPESRLQGKFILEQRKEEMDVSQLYQKMMQKPPMFLKLRLELVDDGKTDESALRMYGKATEGFTRDILISSNFTLHQLHYAIQRAFGWQNQHPHFFTFPKDTMMVLFQALAKEGQKTPLYADWEKVCGIYFRYPITNESDLHWDDDYDGTKSIRSWLRDQYTGSFYYRGYAEHCLECKGAVATVRNANPSVRVYPSFQEYKQATPENPGGRMVPIDEVTFNEANILYLGELVQLLERLPVAELLLPAGTTAQQSWQEIVNNLIDTAAAANAENMEKVKCLKEAIRDAIDLDEEASEKTFCKAYGDYQRFVPQFDPHVIPIAKELIYFYDYEAGWQVRITCQDVYYTKDGWDYPDENGWVRPPITEASFQAQTEAYGRNNETVSEELRQKMLQCHLDRHPQCLAADGLSVMEGVKGLSGFADFLLKIHDGDIEEREQLLEWARNQGWNGRTLKPESIL